MAKLPSGAACARSVTQPVWTWVLVGSVAASTLTNVSFREPRLPVKGHEATIGELVSVDGRRPGQQPTVGGRGIAANPINVRPEYL